MLRKTLMLCGAGFILNLSGCALLSVLMIPIELLISVFGFIFDGIDNAVDAVVRLESIQGPPPVVQRLDDGRFRLTEIAAGARFDVICEAPGAEPVRYRWPDDLAGLARDEAGVARLDCYLAPVTPRSVTPRSVTPRSVTPR